MNCYLQNPHRGTMMRFKVVESIKDSIFPQWDIKLDLYIKSYIDIFLTHKNISQNDIAEIIEYDILCEIYYFDKHCEIDMIFSLYTQDYKDKYSAILTELFFNDMLDFYIIDEPTQPTLSRYKNDKYQAWIYFRDNFITKERFYAEGFCTALWDMPDKWSKHNINAKIAPKGTKYFDEILAPRFYNKYKDLEVEIDERGNIVRWLGEINNSYKAAR